MRQVVLDTETTGLSPEEGHRIIEVGCVELVDRKLTGNHFHEYIQPQRDIEAAAFAVHGISEDFLADKPVFVDISASLISFIEGAELIIHNAPFDVGFLDSEFSRLDLGVISDRCGILDTLSFAKKKHPGQQNSLNALCKRYDISLSERTLHGALLDAELLAAVYLAMTGGQTSLFGGMFSDEASHQEPSPLQKVGGQKVTGLKVLLAKPDELVDHRAQLQEIQTASEDGCLWHGESV